MENPVVRQLSRVSFLGVPFDILPEKNLEPFILRILESGNPWKIVLLTYKDFRRAQRDKEFQSNLLRCGLVLPVDLSLEWGMKVLGYPSPVRYHPFDFLIRLLGILEQKRKSVYLLGGNIPDIHRAAETIRTGFPGLVLVGRHSGYFSKDSEPSIRTAIQKAGPTLLFLGTGLHGNMRWMFESEKAVSSPLTYWSGEAFRIMVGKKNLPPRETYKAQFRKGTLSLRGLWYNPLRWLRVFSYLTYGLQLLFNRIFFPKK